MKQDRANTVVVGSGPGGATVARELARKGDDVIILERGRDHRWSVGSVFAYATMYDIKKSKHGVLVRRGITTGGSTMIYSDNAYDPPAFIKEDLDIDLSSEVAETKEELRIKPVPQEFFRGYKGTLHGQGRCHSRNDFCCSWHWRAPRWYRRHWKSGRYRSSDKHRKSLCM